MKSESSITCLTDYFMRLVIYSLMDVYTRLCEKIIAGQLAPGLNIIGECNNYYVFW